MAEEQEGQGKGKKGLLALLAAAGAALAILAFWRRRSGSEEKE